ncbi:MipA/OmpV family protein [Phyllobacterium leguminum]|uniref:Outer membrane scaffolding protein for murein synthesis (MipA/OmpV family) n=1 Tax=Phyllobacterium leguminum TaxID=314237 RepID=A0A318SZ11_9HYPH|nr:MipA/OmpV family protein [Phyllobacterium leguminum]PYE86590.1 outer membrane scaffolding protein for murein synthesis (MipA/OmpV family) [Phyllobacterium leguminum]
MSYLEQNKRRLSPVAICAAIGIAGLTSQARAADQTASEQAPEPAIDSARFGDGQPKRDWSLIVGGGGAYKPKYEGSDEFEVSPIPFIIFKYGDWLEIDPGGVSVTVLDTNGFTLDAKVGYESGRDEDDGDRLKGLGEIDAGATVGAKLAYDLGPVELYAGIDQTIGGSKSLLGTFGAEYSAPVTERLVLGVQAEATWANEEHMQAYFGVDAAQSARSGLSEYKPGAGIKRVDFSASATYALSENWMVRGQAGIGVLTGDAADSPVVEKKMQPSVSAFVGYKF